MKQTILALLVIPILVSCGLEKEIPVNLGENQLLPEGESITLASNLEGKHTWSTGEETAEITIKDPGTYWVKVENDEGSGIDTIQITRGYYLGRINTNMGEIVFWLYPETPNHRKSFVELAQGSYWDTLTFNRVIPGFVAQGGCPDTPEGFSDSPYLLEPEFNPAIKHVYGAVGAGRDDNPDKLSAGCQFYIVQDKDGIPRLDGNYTVFGHVIQGMDVVDAIVAVDRDERDQPLEDITLDVDVILLTGPDLEQEYNFKFSQ